MSDHHRPIAKSHHFVATPFLIGCAVTPFLALWAFWPLDDTFLYFAVIVISLVFAGVVGAFTQAVADLVRLQEQSRLSWLELAFLGFIAICAVAYGCALYLYPAAEQLLRYGVVSAVPILIGGLYGRLRFYFFARRRDARNV